MIYMIAAISKNNQIGLHQKMPWHIPEDLNYFKKVTSNHTVIMGRKTLESIGRLLPNRHHIILTHNLDFCLSSFPTSGSATSEVAHSIPEVMSLIPKDSPCFVIGGGEIYKAFLPYAEKLYLTLIDKEVMGDTSFPPFDQDFKCISSIPGQALTDDGCSYAFTIWQRQ